MAWHDQIKNQYTALQYQLNIFFYFKDNTK